MRNFPRRRNVLLSICCGAGMWCCLALPAPAQPGGPQTPIEPFPRVLAEWEQVDRRLDEMQRQYRLITDLQQRTVARRQYVEIVESSYNVLAKLRVSALDEYQRSPNQNADVTRVLLGILANDVRGDDFQSAADVARRLLQQNCSEPALYNLAGKAAYCIDDFDGAETLLTRAAELNVIDELGRSYLRDSPAEKRKWHTERQLREQEKDANLPRVRLQTTKGEIILELFENEAPQTVGNFISLVEKKFYDGLIFHDVVAGFMAQTGCNIGNGTGGPGYNIYDECTKADHRNHFSGSISMARTDVPNTGGSQFYITFRPTPHLDGKRTVFGRVISGFEVLPRLIRRKPEQQSDADRVVRAEVIRLRQHPYVPTKVK